MPQQKRKRLQKTRRVHRSRGGAKATAKKSAATKRSAKSAPSKYSKYVQRLHSNMNNSAPGEILINLVNEFILKREKRPKMHMHNDESNDEYESNSGIEDEYSDIIKGMRLAANSNNVAGVIRGLAKLSKYHFNDPNVIPDVFISDARAYAREMVGNKKREADHLVDELNDLISKMEL